MNSLLSEKIEKYFEIEDGLNKSILDQLALYIYFLESQKSQSDLYLLAKLIDQDSLYKLIDYYDGDNLYMPTKEEYQKSYIIGISFFLKKIIGFDWNQIKKFLMLLDIESDDFSTIAIGRRINRIEEELLNSISKTLKKVKIKDIKNLIKEVENE